MSSGMSARVCPPAGRERSTDAPAANEAQPVWPEAPTAKAPAADEARARSRRAFAPTADPLGPRQAGFAPRQREWCQSGDAPPDCDDLLTRILNALYWDLAVPSDHLSVTLEKGWVTISGAVACSYQRSSAEADVRRVSDVRGVTNAIEIESTGSNGATVPCP
jgi:BON domain